MLKKILKGIGKFILVIIVLFTLIGAWTFYKSSGYEETAVPYITKIVPIISKWDHDSSKVYFVPEVLNETSDEDFKKVYKFLSKMGAFISMEAPQFTNVSSSATTENGTMTLVTYTIAAKYSNGDATITIILKEIENGFQLHTFNLNSMALTN